MHTHKHTCIRKSKESCGELVGGREVGRKEGHERTMGFLFLPSGAEFGFMFEEQDRVWRNGGREGDGTGVCENVIM